MQEIIILETIKILETIALEVIIIKTLEAAKTTILEVKKTILETVQIIVNNKRKLSIN